MLLSSSSSPSSSSSMHTLATAGLVTASTIAAVQLLTLANPIGRCLLFVKQLYGQENRLSSSKNVDQGIDSYNQLHDTNSSSVQVRNAQYKSLVNAYYDLATVFYEWGWGASFHFASRYAFETFAESIRRHEYHLASKLGLPCVYGGGGSRGSAGGSTHCNGGAVSAAMNGSRGGEATTTTLSTSPSSTTTTILDVGCGIGGPMRNIARFTQCHVVGLTLNPYQVQRGNELSAADPTVSRLCKSIQGDFMDMPFGDNEFDAAYAIEATCHAPDRNKVYAEIKRVLKPGSIFACLEWCMTDLYDANNAEHAHVKKQIEEGDGLPDICHYSVCVDAMRHVGFEILECRDLVDDEHACGSPDSSSIKPWMLPLMPSWNIFTQRFQFNWLGYRLTNLGIVMLEKLGLAPKGTIKTQRMLQEGAFGLAKGGTLGIFTPMYLMVGRVPLVEEEEAVVEEEVVVQSQ